MSAFHGKILVVDDDITLRRLLEATLEASGFRCDSVDSLPAMRRAIKQRTYDAVLLDLILDDEDGLAGIPFIVQESPGTKIVMMSAHGTIEIAVSAMEKGAASFISKSKDPKNIIDELKKRLAPTFTDTTHTDSLGIIGNSQGIREITAKINQLKDVDTNILIIGETGTGKELIARAIHAASRRRGHRFESLNCGTIPQQLLESELFGHKKGSFTDAKSDRKGIFESCDQGTLLLDEVGEIPHDMQVKLLRVLQENRVTPIGSSESVAVNSRIIAATHQNLSTAMSTSAFREDLYYRLAVITIDVPPLRERIEDIPLLTNHYLEEFNQKFGKSVRHPGPALSSRLNSYSWPGNVRELRNAVERGVVLSTNGDLNLEDMLGSIALEPKTPAQESDHVAFDKSLSEAKQDFERKYLQHLLESTRGNISEMARISGRYRTDIYRLLTKHGVDWEEFRPE